MVIVSPEECSASHFCKLYVGNNFNNNTKNLGCERKNDVFLDYRNDFNLKSFFKQTKNNLSLCIGRIRSQTQPLLNLFNSKQVYCTYCQSLTETNNQKEPKKEKLSISNRFNDSFVEKINSKVENSKNFIVNRLEENIDHKLKECRCEKIDQKVQECNCEMFGRNKSHTSFSCDVCREKYILKRKDCEGLHRCCPSSQCCKCCCNKRKKPCRFDCCNPCCDPCCVPCCDPCDDLNYYPDLYRRENDRKKFCECGDNRKQLNGAQLSDEEKKKLASDYKSENNVKCVPDQDVVSRKPNNEQFVPNDEAYRKRNYEKYFGDDYSCDRKLNDSQGNPYCDEKSCKFYQRKCPKFSYVKRNHFSEEEPSLYPTLHENDRQFPLRDYDHNGKPCVCDDDRMWNMQFRRWWGWNFGRRKNRCIPKRRKPCCMCSCEEPRPRRHYRTRTRDLYDLWDENNRSCFPWFSRKPRRHHHHPRMCYNDPYEDCMDRRFDYPPPRDPYYSYMKRQGPDCKYPTQKNIFSYQENQPIKENLAKIYSEQNPCCKKPTGRREMQESNQKLYKSWIKEVSSNSSAASSVHKLNFRSNKSSIEYLSCRIESVTKSVDNYRECCCCCPCNVEQKSALCQTKLVDKSKQKKQCCKCCRKKCTKCHHCDQQKCTFNKKVEASEKKTKNAPRNKQADCPKALPVNKKSHSSLAPTEDIEERVNLTDFDSIVENSEKSQNEPESKNQMYTSMQEDSTGNIFDTIKKLEKKNQTKTNNCAKKQKCPKREKCTPRNRTSSSAKKSKSDEFCKINRIDPTNVYFSHIKTSPLFLDPIFHSPLTGRKYNLSPQVQSILKMPDFKPTKTLEPWNVMDFSLDMNNSDFFVPSDIKNRLKPLNNSSFNKDGGLFSEYTKDSEDYRNLSEIIKPKYTKKGSENFKERGINNFSQMKEKGVQMSFDFEDGQNISGIKPSSEIKNAFKSLILNNDKESSNNKKSAFIDSLDEKLLPFLDANINTDEDYMDQKLKTQTHHPSHCHQSTDKSTKQLHSNDYQIPNKTKMFNKPNQLKQSRSLDKMFNIHRPNFNQIESIEEFFDLQSLNSADVFPKRNSKALSRMNLPEFLKTNSILNKCELNELDKIVEEFKNDSGYEDKNEYEATSLVKASKLVCETLKRESENSDSTEKSLLGASRLVCDIMKNNNSTCKQIRNDCNELNSEKQKFDIDSIVIPPPTSFCNLQSGNEKSFEHDTSSEDYMCLEGFQINRDSDLPNVFKQGLSPSEINDLIDYLNKTGFKKNEKVIPLNKNVQDDLTSTSFQVQNDFTSTSLNIGNTNAITNTNLLEVKSTGTSTVDISSIIDLDFPSSEISDDLKSLPTGFRHRKTFKDLFKKNRKNMMKKELTDSGHAGCCVNKKK